MIRPRGGQCWRNRDTGAIVKVESRRTVNPMERVRPSNMRWSLVHYSGPGVGIGMEHESDFVRCFEYVGPHCASAEVSA